MKSVEDIGGKIGVAEFDFFRYRAWRGKVLKLFRYNLIIRQMFITLYFQNVLENYVNNERFTKDKELLAMKLKAAANDLSEAAEEILSGGLSNIGFYTTDGKHVQNPART